MGGGHFAGRERLNLKNQKTEKNDPHQSQSNLHQNFYSEFLRKILNRFNRKRYFFENSSGTILIEFAFCVPVLILLLLYINDIMILARTQDEMKRAAYCAVQLIQNVSRNRTNKLITRRDLLCIANAWIIMNPNGEKFIKSGGINQSTIVILAEGTGNDKCKVKWIYYAYQRFYFMNDSVWLLGFINENINTSGSIASWFQSAFPKAQTIYSEQISTSLYPDFHIKEGEIKCVLHLQLHDINRHGGETLKKLLGLYILNPPVFYCDSRYNNVASFPAHVIFTPIDGIFSTTRLPQ